MAKATSSGLEALQRALYGWINRPPITAPPLNAKVYDHIPQNATPPLVRIDVIPGATWDTFGCAGTEYRADLHVFTTYSGTLQAAQIIDALTGMMDDADLLVVGFTVWDVARLEQQHADDEVVGGVQTAHRIAPFLIRMTEGETV